MHCITSSLCFWISTIINETVDTVVQEEREDYSNGSEADDHFFNNMLNLDMDSGPKAAIGRECAVKLVNLQNIIYIVIKIVCKMNSEEVCANHSASFDYAMSCYVATMCECTRDGIASSLFTVTPYLYPFSIEFNILVGKLTMTILLDWQPPTLMNVHDFAVGVWYVMWSNIGNVAEHRKSLEFLPSPRRSIDSGTGKPLNDALYIYADCHAAIKGIFFGRQFFFENKTSGSYFLKPGLGVLVLAIIGIIAYYAMAGNDDYKDSGLITNDVIESLILGAMIPATILVSSCFYHWIKLKQWGII